MDLTAAPILGFLPLAAAASPGFGVLGVPLILWVGLAIVVLGLLVYGLGDLLRISPRRISAIASVSFADAIRRRVLWVLPLVMLGVLIVAQLLNPTDEQDAVRQTIKYALFSTGLVVVTMTLILACTNLPREIESRVIYTVVTKPTTRLEIVLGKVWGLGLVSALLLGIMGLFTLAFTSARAAGLHANVVRQLSSDVAADNPARAAWLAHHASEGLLSARSYGASSRLDVVAGTSAELADAAGIRRRPAMYSGTMSAVAQFMLHPDRVGSGQSGSLLVLRMTAEPLAGDLDDIEDNVPSPFQTPAARSPAVTVEVTDSAGYAIPGGVVTPANQPLWLSSDPNEPTYLPLSGELTQTMLRQQAVRVRVSGVTRGYIYLPQSGSSAGDGTGDASAISLVFPDPATEGATVTLHPLPLPGDGGSVQLRGGESRFGMQVYGPEGVRQPVAIYRFADISPAAADATGRVPLELRVSVERSGETGEMSDVTLLEAVVRNRTSGFTTTPIAVYPESRRATFIPVPVEAVEGGQFDVELRTLTPGHAAAITEDGIALVTGRVPFAWNLAKHLFAAWLLTLLVATIGVFCSTFLSWPIAVVLTLVLLLGNWAVTQVGDAMSQGIGTQVANQLFADNFAQARVVSETVTGLTTAVRTLGAFLPDMSAFATIEPVERGANVPAAWLLRSLFMTLGFGLPLTVLAYVLLRNKEVAP